MRRLAALDTTRQIALAAMVLLLLGVVTVAVPVLRSPGLLIASAALIAVIAVVWQWLWQSRGATDWTHTFVAPPVTRGADLRIARITGDVRAAAGGDPQAGNRLHATLTSLAEDRLRLRRGLSLTADPEESRAALGPELTAYLTQPPPARLPGDRLAAFTTTLEEI